MNSKRGITLISVIITILLLLIIAGLVITQGTDTFQKSRVAKFEANMIMIQKKVDIIMEEGEEIPGLKMTTAEKSKLKQIIDEDSKTNKAIETNNVEEPLLRYFTSQEIETELGIQDIQDEVVINFANREVISLNGIKKDGKMYYVEKSLH